MLFLLVSAALLVLSVMLVLVEVRQGARAVTRTNMAHVLLAVAVAAALLALRQDPSPIRWGMVALSMALYALILYWAHGMTRLPQGGALKGGRLLPDGVLRRAATDSLVPTREIWPNGPSLLVLYRGPWCGYCRGELERIRGMVGESDVPVQVIALSHEHPEPRLPALVRKVGDRIDLYQDPGGEWLKALGAYQAGGHPSGRAGLAVPGLAWIDRDGRVMWSWRADNVRHRLEPAAALQAGVERGLIQSR